MGKDWPDWGQSYTNAAFYPLLDHGELAARLGSIVVYDRRGSVLWLCDFRYGLNLVDTGTVGGSSSVDLWTSPILSPPFSCRLRSGTGANEGGNISKKLPVPNASRVGFSFHLQAGLGVDKVEFNLTHFDAVNRYDANVTFDVDGGNLTIEDDDLGTVTIASSLSFAGLADVLQFVKLVIDLDAHKYERLMFGGNEYDLSTYSLPVLTSSTEARIGCQIKQLNKAGGASSVFVDNLIFSANEPANS